MVRKKLDDEWLGRHVAAGGATQEELAAHPNRSFLSGVDRPDNRAEPQSLDDVSDQMSATVAWLAQHGDAVDRYVNTMEPEQDKR